MELKVTRVGIDDAGVATVWLHRPERHNSWTARMHAEYRWIMADLEANAGVRVVVLTGSGPAFCVGADSKALSGYVKTDGFDTGLPTDAARPGYGVRPEFDADVAWQLGLRFPLICAVNGSCAGVALAMAAFSDIRFAVTGAKITTATPKLAMPAEYGLSWILPRLVGLTNAADILLSGRVLLSDELAGMGFFNRVFNPETFQEGVYGYARTLAALSPEATKLTKRQLYDDLLHADPARSVEKSKELIGQCMSMPDYAEGVRALVEKRAPRFGGEHARGD
jgi:enoyl-CoA hydratase/carnithine racemase